MVILSRPVWASAARRRALVDSGRAFRTLLAATLAVGGIVASGGAAASDDVRVRSGADPSARLFPSDRFTVPDWTQNTRRRVALPKPDCAARPSDCADVGVLNTLDGFSTQPRITVPFTGPIDVASVNADTIYLVALGDTLGGRGAGRRIGINQILWDPMSNTLVFQPDELLDEHARYAVVVTNGIRDARGRPIARAGGDGDDADDDRNDDAGWRSAWYASQASRFGARADGVAAVSVFTTQSTSADLAKIARQIKKSTPAPVDFNVAMGAGGAQRAVFPVSSVVGINFSRQVGTAPSFADAFLPTPALGIVPGAVGRLAYGRFASPNFELAGQFIPPTGSLTGRPRAQGSQELIVQLFVPAGPKPAGGWPVAIFGHGFTDSIYGAPWTVAAVFAANGIATASINVVGHGGGPLGTLTVLRNNADPVVVNAGGRGFDQDGNGTIDSTEGVNAAPPRTLIASRDGLRQTVIDLMQLVREIEIGVDVDGDGSADLNPRRIYYAGQSFGGIYGTILLGVEPNLAAGVANVPGGSITEIARLGVFRPLTGIALATRQPALINVADPSGIAFNENMPLRDLPPVINDVPGAMAIAALLDRNQWAQQAGNPVSYAARIRKQPLPGNRAKPVLIQFAKGDVTVPNPTTTAILRAGDLADRAVYFRNDLARALNSAVATNPHTFLTNIGDPAGAAYAIGAQQQIAVFFATGGATVIDPDGALPFFEVPIVGALPEGLNYLP